MRARRVEAARSVSSSRARDDGKHKGMKKMTSMNARGARRVALETFATRARTTTTTTTETSFGDVEKRTKEKEMSRMRMNGVSAPFAPSGDQGSAIEACARMLRDERRRFVCLRGATGTGKTYVVANVLAAMDVPTLVVVPNKTLAAQVARELRTYLGETRRVELFVSHFSVYVPESFSNGRYTEKRSAVDSDLDALRHRATRALVEPGKTPVVVASVSCLYGLGLPTDYVDAALTIEVGASASKYGIDGVEDKLRDDLLYERVMPYMDVERGQFRRSAAPDAENCFDIQIWPPYLESALDIRVRGDDGTIVSCVYSKGARAVQTLTIWPRVHYITPAERLQRALVSIRGELDAQTKALRAEGSAIEADRLEQRTNADLALLRELGWCPGAEHYSRHLRCAKPEEPPVTLLDYFSYSAEGGAGVRREWLLVADESHVMLPQLRAMHGGDRSRKTALVGAGYRLPSALDNRPLMGDEFWQRVPQALLVSATPGDEETEWVGGKDSDSMVDMVVRPSGVLDPPVTIVPKENQLEALAQRVKERALIGERSLVCVLTKADTEDLTMYLNAHGVRADWVHSELTAPQRATKLSKLQQGQLDCIVGAQLLREGLDLPSVSLVAILDADVPGFMRSARSLMQMMGRAARNKNGECVLFADSMTAAMKEAIAEVDRRRIKQHNHNVANNLTPQTATLSSSTSTLSLFEVMADEIESEKEKWAVEQSVALTSERANIDDEAVEKALKSWRKRREGGGVRPGPKPSDALKLDAKVEEDEKLRAENILDSYGIDASHVERLRRLSKDMPAKTGVYRWLDEAGVVLYVGKAKNLRSRTSHYLAPALIQSSPRHRKLLASARTLDSVLTPGGEADALALEARLIQRERPALNILLKDAPRPESARIVLTSKNGVGQIFVAKFQDEAQAEASKGARLWTLPTREAANRMMAILESALDLRGVSFRSRFGETAAVARWHFVSEVASLILDAKYEDAIQMLEDRGEISAALELRVSAQEEAERGQGSRGSLAALLQADSVAKHWNMDVIAAASSGGGHCAVKIVKVRDGIIVDVLGTSIEVPNASVEEAIADATLAEAAQIVAEQMYSGEFVDRPDLVYIPHSIAEPLNLRSALKSLGVGVNKHNGKVLHHGAAKEGTLLEALATMALENAGESARSTASKSIAAMRLRDVIGLSEIPRSIEGVDVSHLAGTNAVCSFVRFEGGSAMPFKHKRYQLSEDVTPSDDYGGIAESIGARLASKSKLPDVFLIDGGVGQLTAAATALAELGITISNMRGGDAPGEVKPRSVALVALAKGRSSGEEALWIPARLGIDSFGGVKVDVAAKDESLQLLRAVRDSAHAVALGAHRTLRREERLRSFAA